MIDFKKKIAEYISRVTQMNLDELENYIEIPQNTDFGDYAFPCFKLAKELRKSPQMIANEIKENIEVEEEIIEKIEIIGGYLNFYVTKKALVESVLREIALKGEEFGKLNIGEGKKVVIDYSSPNIAKPFHIGHLRTTVIGGALYNIYRFIGYQVIGVNHLGDYGTQFGKLIEGYKRWGKEYDIEKNPIDELTKIYIRINELCKEDESVLEMCRDNFKQLEEGNKYHVSLWQKFKDLSLKEFQRVYDILRKQV
jgi:arginyl-tRNA synthetase